MIVGMLTDPKDPAFIALDLAGREPEHMAQSIATVLACLWEARQFMEWKHLPPTKHHPYGNGRWVPIAKIERCKHLAGGGQ
jgi:hypothetical protein